MKKLRDHRGETMIESLAAVLLVTIIMIGLTTAIASAARVNAKVRDTDVSFQYADAPSKTINVTVKESNVQIDTFSSDEYTATNGYHYYEYHQEAGQ